MTVLMADSQCLAMPSAWLTRFHKYLTQKYEFHCLTSKKSEDLANSVFSKSKFSCGRSLMLTWPTSSAAIAPPAKLILTSMLGLVLTAGCNFQPAVKYQLDKFQLDMPASELKKLKSWEPDVSGWDLVSAGTLRDIPGNFRVNLHKEQVVEVHFSVNSSDDLPSETLQQQAEEILRELTQQFGPPTFKRVRLYETDSDPNDPKRPYSDRIEWRDRDYRMVVGIRKDDFHVTIDNTLAESLRALDRQQK